MGGIFTTYNESYNKKTIMPTVLRVTKEELDYWTNMTCFYDKNWEFNPKLSTVPISFMHITNVTEVTTAQGAEKRVIIYEAPQEKGKSALPSVVAHPAHRSNLEVIMDNVVVQPKQYQMEVVIPASLIGPYHQQGLSRLTALVEYMQRTGATDDDSAVSNIASGIQWAQVAIETFQTASDVLDTVLGATAGSTQMSTMNKNSIDAMAGSGHVVVFKRWTGYDYCYGIITKLDISKKPTEEGVFRGSITFQEAPILNISTKNLNSPVGLLASIGSAASYITAQTMRIANLALAYPFIAMTGVMDEAGAPGSSESDGGWFWDIF